MDGDKIILNILASLFVLFLIDARNGVSGQSYMDYINGRLSELCPYSTFCKQGPSIELQNESNVVPCCTPCSCEDDCNIVGNCCPDASSSSNDIQPSMECRSTIFTSATYLLKYFEGISYYYIINTCPPQYQDNETIEKCINPRFEHLNDIKDATIVSTATRIYSNRHCAKCNNVASFTMWRPVLHNFDQDVGHGTLMPVKYILEYLPPGANTPENMQCYISTVNECNIFGQQQVNYHYLHRACQDTTLYYRHDHLDESKIYKNPFCFICNNIQGTKLQGKCAAKDGEGILLIDNSRGGPRESFTVVLSLHNTDAANDNYASICPTDEIYDTHFDVCRKLHCPMFKLPVDEQCVSPYVSVLHYQLVVVVKMVTDIGVDFDAIDRGSKQRINDKLTKIIGFTDRGCSHCRNFFVTRKQNNSTDLFLFMPYRITHACHFQTFLDICRELSKSTIQFTVEIQSRPVVFQWQLNYEFSSFDMIYDIEKYYDYYVNVDAHDCSFSYMLQDRFCDYIEISIEDYNTLKNGSYAQANAEQFRLVNNEEGQYVYRTCKEDYISNKSRNDASNLILRLPIFLISLYVCISIRVSGWYG